MKVILFLLLSTVTVFAQNSVYIDQIGSSNQIYIEQKDFDGKNATVLNQGDLNIVNMLQQGTGSHSATISSTVNNTGNNNSNLLEINQQGSGNHTASITFNNGAVGSSNNDVKLTQSGSANKQFNLTLQGNGIGFVGIQDNFSVADSASMSITCLTPPCSGYSYTKN
jgi:hypothetical protein